MLVRKAKLSDLREIFNWRNDEHTRKMSLNSKYINFEEHKEWFTDSLKNELYKIYIGELGTKKIGICIFYNIKTKNLSEVSINFNPYYRGKGYSKQFLRKSISLYRKNFNTDVIAKIKSKNLISISIFKNIGFYRLRIDRNKVLYYLLSKQTLFFKKINLNDSNVLYALLKKRIHFISHKKTPSLNSHKNFIKNNPYQHWFLIVYKRPIGTFYIQKDNSIGIQLLRPKIELISEILYFINCNFKPFKEVQSKVPSYFYINVASSDNEMKKILKNMNFDLIQESYKLI